MSRTIGCSAQTDAPEEATDDSIRIKSQRLVALFLLGVLLFNYPLLALFNRAGDAFGIPVLYVYIFVRVGAADRPARARDRALALARPPRPRRPPCSQSWVIIPVALAYLGVLFAIAYYGDKRADAGPLDHRQPVHLRAVARRLRDGVDVLRQRRARGRRRRRLPADLHRPDADDGAVVARDAQDHPHQQGEPHHLARRLHRRRATARARCSPGSSRSSR